MPQKEQKARKEGLRVKKKKIRGYLSTSELWMLKYSCLIERRWAVLRVMNSLRASKHVEMLGTFWFGLTEVQLKRRRELPRAGNTWICPLCSVEARLGRGGAARGNLGAVSLLWTTAFSLNEPFDTFASKLRQAMQWHVETELLCVITKGLQRWIAYGHNVRKNTFAH